MIRRRRFLALSACAAAFTRPAAAAAPHRWTGQALGADVALTVAGGSERQARAFFAEAARALRANDAMYFALMRHARDRGCTAFDFGRSKAGTGPAAFKKNWGFTPQPLAYATWTRDGAAPRDASPLNPKYRLKIAAWQRLPLAVANRVGPWIARGLG